MQITHCFSLFMVLWFQWWRLSENDPNCKAAAPPHARIHHPVLFRNGEPDNIRNTHRVGKNDPGALIGNVMNEAVQRAVATVEVDAAAGNSADVPTGGAHPRVNLLSQPPILGHIAPTGLYGPLKTAF